MPGLANREPEMHGEVFVESMKRSKYPKIHKGEIPRPTQEELRRSERRFLHYLVPNVNTRVIKDFLEHELDPEEVERNPIIRAYLH